MRRILLWSLGAGALCATLLAARVVLAADGDALVNHLKLGVGCNTRSASTHEFGRLATEKDRRPLGLSNEGKSFFLDPALLTPAPGEKVNHMPAAMIHSNLSAAGAANRFGVMKASQEYRSNASHASFQDVDGKH